MNTKEAGYNLGIFHGAIKHDVEPLNIHKIDGTDAALEDYFRKQSHIKVMKAAHKIMCKAGHEQTYEARLVNALSQVQRETSAFTKQASDLVFDTIFEFKKYAAFEKRADDMGIGGTALTAAALIPLVAGAGAGGLYWGLKRDAEEQNIENKMKRQKIQYYTQLADELKERMSSRYSEE